MIDPAALSQYLPGLSAVRALAEGGQKWVYEASHTMDGDVVVKLIKRSGDARVEREIQAIGQIACPRVPPILEHGVINVAPVGDIVWLRERRVDGESLRDVVGRGPLGRDDVLNLSLHVLEALAEAARVRIVHRDVKPDNIIRAHDGSFWLLDFGLARHLDLTSLTPTMQLNGPGTIGYAPPEQFRNRKREIDSRTDLFALAVTVVECMTGTNPYRHGARDAAEVLRRVEGSPLVFPRIGWDIEQRFTDLVSAMGQRRLDCRPRDVEEALVWMRDIHARFGL